MKNLGNKIVIVGVSASGKSVFARRLSDKTNLPLIFMDSIMWNPGWNYVGDDKTLQELGKVSRADEWIIEGYITTKARTFLFDRADTIIYLDYLPIISSYRYVKRWWKHKKDPRPELEGSPERFSLKFLKLVWAKGESKTLNRFLDDVKNQSKIVKFTSPSEAKTFLSKL